jgi:hypothetical protein
VGRREPKLVTTDQRDFGVYRPKGIGRFDLLP